MFKNYKKCSKLQVLRSYPIEDPTEDTIGLKQTCSLKHFIKFLGIKVKGPLFNIPQVCLKWAIFWNLVDVQLSGMNFLIMHAYKFDELRKNYLFQLKTHEESTVSFALEDLITRSFRTKKPEQKIVVEEPIRLEELTKDEPTQSETISRISDQVHAEDIAIEISLDDRYKGWVSNFFSIID